MNILHISNDFAGSKVHSNLVRELDCFDLSQVVYCPLRDASKDGKNKFDGQNVTFKYSYVLRPWHKFFYHYKQQLMYNDLLNRIDISNINLIHAATLFTDGGVAYRAYKDYGIKYVVAIRNTDINAFAKLQKHLFPIGRKILLNASKIYFISKALQVEFESLKLVKPILAKIQNKLVLRPNGIDSCWLENISSTQRNGKRILYIGNFSPNKNVVRLIEAVKLLRTNPAYSDTTLTIIGGGGDYKDKTLKAIESNRCFISYLGSICDKNELRNIMQRHTLFAMPSIHETFGLVYIEAISQNLPVVHTKGQGIDFLFPIESPFVSKSVNAHSVEDICNTIAYIIDHLPEFSNRNVNFNMFNWSLIAREYYNDYTSILGC